MSELVTSTSLLKLNIERKIKRKDWNEEKTYFLKLITPYIDEGWKNLFSDDVLNNN